MRGCLYAECRFDDAAAAMDELRKLPNVDIVIFSNGTSSLTDLQCLFTHASSLPTGTEDVRPLPRPARVPR